MDSAFSMATGSVIVQRLIILETSTGHEAPQNGNIQTNQQQVWTYRQIFFHTLTMQNTQSPKTGGRHNKPNISSCKISGTVFKMEA